MSGETPLMQAARRGNVEIVRALLAAKADPNAKEKNGGQNRLDVGAVATSVRGGRGAAYAAAPTSTPAPRPDFTPLMFAAQQGDVDSARILLKAGAKPNDAEAGTG